MTPMNKTFCLPRSIHFRILAAGLVLSLWSVAAPAQENTSYSDPGRFPVRNVETIALKDNLRGTDVLVRVYYPEGAGPFPVIAFSHMNGGNKDMFSEIATHWASHGYVAVHSSHDDTGVTMAPNGGGMQPSEQKVRDRLRDVIVVFDALDQIERDVPALAGKLDRQKLAVAGHSYGSFISFIAGGATIDIGGENNANLGDSRVKCILPMSPSGPGDYGLSEASWRNMTIPTLIFNGTNDARAGRPEDWRMEPYRLSPEGNKFQIIIEGATHIEYGGDIPGDAPKYVKAASAAFFDFCLNGTAEGKSYLQAGFSRFANGAAAISFK